MQRTRLYRIVFAACAGGYTWLFVQKVFFQPAMEYNTVCLIKNFSGIPCPSCGSSRSVLAILQGNFGEAFLWNPIGYFIAAILLISPVWITFDLISSGDSFLRAYCRVEKFFRNKWITVPAIMLLAANWMWTITKGL